MRGRSPAPAPVPLAPPRSTDYRREHGQTATAGHVGALKFVGGRNWRIALVQELLYRGKKQVGVSLESFHSGEYRTLDQESPKGYVGLGRRRLAAQAHRRVDDLPVKLRGACVLASDPPLVAKLCGNQRLWIHQVVVRPEGIRRQVERPVLQRAGVAPEEQFGEATGYLLSTPEEAGEGGPVERALGFGRVGQFERGEGSEVCELDDRAGQRADQAHVGEIEPVASVGGVCVGGGGHRGPSFFVARCSMPGWHHSRASQLLQYRPGFAE